MIFGRKHIVGAMLIAVVLTSSSAIQVFPIFGDRNTPVHTVVRGSDVSNGTLPINDLQNKSVVDIDLLNETKPMLEPSIESSYRRERDYERWAYPNGTVQLVMYMGPRFVRHYATGQFVDLVFEDHYASEGYYLVQNAYVGLKIYDNRTVMYDPDMEYIAVDEEYVAVQVYDAEALLWVDLNFTDSYLRADANNATVSVITRIHEGAVGRAEVSYVVRSGELMKNSITFTSFSDIPGQFRAVQKILGIRGNKVTYENVDGSRERLTVNASMELVVPFLSLEEDDQHTLSVSLRDLGHVAEAERWTSQVLKKIALYNYTEGIGADIIMGDFSLSHRETFAVDPDFTTTPHVMHSNDDISIWNMGMNYENLSDIVLWFGKTGSDPSVLTFRSYMRWPILIPDGADVQSAYMNLSSSEDQTKDFTPEIRTLNFTDCPQFTDDEEVTWNYEVMGNVTGWQITEDWSEGERVSVDVTKHLEEFMDRPDYALGNHMGLRIDEGNSDPQYDEWREVYAYGKGVA